LGAMSAVKMAAVVEELLIANGYPTDALAGWWTSVWPGLDGRTPEQAWADGDYDAVWQTVVDGYAASARAARRFLADPAAVASTREKIEELDRLYA
jgi:hypothetical protein